MTALDIFSMSPFLLLQSISHLVDRSYESIFVLIPFFCFIHHLKLKSFQYLYIHTKWSRNSTSNFITYSNFLLIFISTNVNILRRWQDIYEWNELKVKTPFDICTSKGKTKFTDLILYIKNSISSQMGHALMFDYLLGLLSFELTSQ